MRRVEGGFGGLMEDTQQTCRIKVHLKVRFEAVEMDGIIRGSEQREGEDAGLRLEPTCLKVRKQVKQTAGPGWWRIALLLQGHREQGQAITVSVRWDVGEGRGDGN